MLTSDTSFGLAISTACPANYVDSIAPALLHLYGARGLTIQFVKNLIEHEIKRTGNLPVVLMLIIQENHAILFRGNNAAPRIITAFIHLQADNYLNDTLGTLLSDAIRDPRLQGFSTSSNISALERETNLRYIQYVAKRFLDAIVNSADSLPPYPHFTSFADLPVL